MAAFGPALFAIGSHGAHGLPAPDANGHYNVYLAALIALLLIPFGAAVGQFLEYTYNVDRDLTYADLITLNTGRWKPRQRYVNNLTTAYLFAAILGIDAFKVGVLSILLNDFISTKPLVSLAIGFVSGFAFPVVRDLVGKFKPVERS